MKTRITRKNIMYMIFFIFFTYIGGGLDFQNISAESKAPFPMKVLYPLDGVLFPKDIAAPTFRWDDSSPAKRWQVTVQFSNSKEQLQKLISEPQWQPNLKDWKFIKNLSLEKTASITIKGLKKNGLSVLSSQKIQFSTSKDPVTAPIFYRDVPLPFKKAIKNLGSIRWRLGTVSSQKEPHTVLENMNVCGNCHSFSADGKTLAMDVDYGSDKGSYIITDVKQQIIFNKNNVISWSNYKKNDKEPTLGLLAQISPNGRYVLSTVKDRSVFVPRDEIYYSQFFFPVKGILAFYDRKTKKINALAGADNREFVQSNPSWSPDSKWIVFAREKAFELKNIKKNKSIFLKAENVREFISGERKLLYDLYRIPFNNGKGGTAEPLKGASKNGKSNYFAKYSPDGKWIIFCQSNGFMLLRPDSLLYIIPSEGGTPRQLKCNMHGYMNSWHSWSPNGKWLVFSSKANGPYTQLWLTHIDEHGNDSPPVLLENFTSSDRAANIPEFVNISPDDLKEIIPTFTDKYTIVVRNGKMKMNALEYNKAINEFKNALKIKPDDVEVMIFLSKSLLTIGKIKEAFYHLKKAEILEGNNPDVYTLLSVAFYKSMRFKQAIIHGKKAIDLDAGLVLAQNTLGQSYHRLGNLPKAIKHYRNVIDKGHETSSLFTNYGLALKQMKNYDEAIKQFQKALLSNPKNQTARRYLIETMRKKNR